MKKKIVAGMVMAMVVVGMMCGCGSAKTTSVTPAATANTVTTVQAVATTTTAADTRAAEQTPLQPTNIDTEAEQQKAAQEQVAKEQAEKEAQEKAAKEQAEKEAQEQAAKEQAEKEAQEQAAREAEQNPVSQYDAETQAHLEEERVAHEVNDAEDGNYFTNSEIFWDRYYSEDCFMTVCGNFRHDGNDVTGNVRFTFGSDTHFLVTDNNGVETEIAMRSVPEYVDAMAGNGGVALTFDVENGVVTTMHIISTGAPDVETAPTIDCYDMQ